MQHDGRGHGGVVVVVVVYLEGLRTIYRYMVYDRWTVEPAISNTFDIYLIYLSNILCVL